MSAERSRAVAERTYQCCICCADDQPHVEKDSHELPCTLCQERDELAELRALVESQAAEIERLAGELESAQKRLAAVLFIHAEDGFEECDSCVDPWGRLDWPCPTAVAAGAEGGPR